MLKFGPLAHISGLKDVNICVLEFCTNLDMTLIWATDEGIKICYKILCKTLGRVLSEICDEVKWFCELAWRCLKRYCLIQELWGNNYHTLFRHLSCIFLMMHISMNIYGLFERLNGRSLELFANLIWKLGVGACKRGIRQGVQSLVRIMLIVI